MKFDLNIENINYLKITYRDKDGFAHCVKAAVRLISVAEVLACIKYEEDLSIPAPQDVELGIACVNGFYMTKTKLKKLEKEPPYLLFSMSKPDEMDFQQNREFFRVKLQEDTTIIYYDDNEQEVELSAITYDISANGVRIELDKDIVFPENVKIKLFLPNRQIEVNAKYIRTDNDDNITKASFRFEDLASADLDYISQVCFQKQLEQRRKSLM